jgi:serine protease
MIAQGNNDEGILGVIPDGPEKSKVCLMIARVFADGSDITSISAVIGATEWCSDGGADVINLSVAATADTSSEWSVYEEIYNQGVLLVAASGNEGNGDFAYPASHDSVISVASANNQLEKSPFSQYNDRVELTAPGSEVLTTTGTDSVGPYTGTSFAS